MKKLFIILLLVFTSCNLIMMSMMGLKSPKAVSDKEIIKYAHKFNIPTTDLYKLDTSYYSYLFGLDTAKFKNEIHDHYQPLQVLYYHNQNFVSFQINCNTGGFPNLDWNKNGEFETFPPKFQNPLDSVFTLIQHLNFLIPLEGNKLKKDFSDDEYFVFVHWNRFMGKQSKRLIKFVQNNADLVKNKRIKIIYVNNDNFFSNPNLKIN